MCVCACGGDGGGGGAGGWGWGANKVAPSSLRPAFKRSPVKCAQLSLSV